MKKIWLFVLTLALTGGIVQAQGNDKNKDKDQKTQMDQGYQNKDQSKSTAEAKEEAGEKAVHITSGPTVANVTGTSATLEWTTNKPGANDVHYNCGGKDKVAYHRGGGTNHSVTLTGLKPSSTCSWKVMTHDGDVRQQGSFQTPAH